MKKEVLFDYVLKNFQLFYEITDFNLLDISYGFNNQSRIQIKDNSQDFFSKENDVNFGDIYFKKVNNENIPFLFQDYFDELYTVEENQIKINFDLIANSFYFLSGWQEYVSKEKDEFGRFTYDSSIQKKLNITAIPVVNYYFEVLKITIEKAYGISINPKIKNNFATILTHDIDTCESAWLQGGFSELKKGKPFRSLKLLMNKLFKKDAWFNFNEIIEIEKKYNAKSTFFFLPRKGNYRGFKNGDYNIKTSSLKQAIKQIREQHFEVGIHGSFGTHDNLDRYKEEIGFFDHKIISNRFHFLNFDIHQTPSILEEAGISYDYSLGFAEHIGFRNSYCYPYYLFDFKNQRMTNVIEIPLTVMDATLQNKKYMNLEKDAIQAEIKILITQIKRFNGCFSLLWHNTHFSDYKYGGWKDIYIDILEYCKRNNSIITNGEGLYEIIQNK